MSGNPKGTRLIFGGIYAVSKDGRVFSRKNGWAELALITESRGKLLYPRTVYRLYVPGQNRQRHFRPSRLLYEAGFAPKPITARKKIKSQDAVLKMLASGKSVREIASQYGVSTERIGFIRRLHELRVG